MPYGVGMIILLAVVLLVPLANIWYYATVGYRYVYEAECAADRADDDPGAGRRRHQARSPPARC